MDQQADEREDRERHVTMPQPPESLHRDPCSSLLASTSTIATATTSSKSLDVANRKYSRALVRRLFYDGNSQRILASHLAHGGPDTFWPYIPSSLNLVRAPMVVRDNHPFPACLEPHLIPRGNGFTVKLDAETRRTIHGATVSYCREHPGDFIKVQTAGIRTQKAVPVHQRLMHTDTFCCTSDVNCLRAAVANAIFRFSSADATKFLQSGLIPEDRFGTLTSWMQHNCKGYQLQHCPYDTKTPDAWVMEQTEGVYVLIIKGNNSAGYDVEHIVTIDAGAQIIIDSCEENELQFSWSVLQKCIGNARYVDGVDVRHVHHQPITTGRKDKRKRKRNLTKYQQEKKIQKRAKARDLAVHRSILNMNKAK